MGIVYSKIILRNPRFPELEPIEVEAMADSGALFLCIPEALCSRLRLEQVPYVGPVEVRFKNRVGFTGAIVIGDQVLVGAIAMEELDLVVIPRTRELDVNPASPDRASSIVKQGEPDYSVE